MMSMATTSVRKLHAFSVAHRDVLSLSVFNGCRFISIQTEKVKVKPPGFIKRYLVDRVMNMITSSTSRLEKAYPTVFQIYKTFKTGLSNFVQDSREYYTVSTNVWSGQSLPDLSRRQLELLRQVPKDFVKIIPVLLLTLIPGGSAAFPVAYVFPRLLLSHHFWTEQQRHQFLKRDLKYRLEHLQPTLDNLLLMASHIDDEVMKDRIIQIAKKLQHTVHPTVSEVLDVKPLFESSPYNLERLSMTYVRHLGKTMRMSLRRKWLRHDAMLLYYMDMAMLREGVECMTDFELERACYWRGLNPVGLQRKERICYLIQWANVSKFLNEKNISLLLHMPLLFGFCQPTNRELMGGWRYRFRIRRPSEPST